MNWKHLAAALFLALAMAACGAKEEDVNVPKGDPNGPGPKPTQVAPPSGGTAGGGGGAGAPQQAGTQ